MHNAYHNIEGCTTLHCRLCQTAAQDRVTAKRAQSLRTGTLIELSEGISNADLQRIANTFPNLLTEAVRELNGEVRYEQVNRPKDGWQDNWITGE